MQTRILETIGSYGSTHFQWGFMRRRYLFKIQNCILDAKARRHKISYSYWMRIAEYMLVVSNMNGGHIMPHATNKTKIRYATMFSLLSLGAFTW